MIIYRPIPPLTAGRTGLKSALAAMAFTALLGTTWQALPESSGSSDITAETAWVQPGSAPSPDSA